MFFQNMSVKEAISAVKAQEAAEISAILSEENINAITEEGRHNHFVWFYNCVFLNCEIWDVVISICMNMSEKIALGENELHSLTGKPSATDVLLYCVAVCAPYSALTDYKYKVKLIPGTSKRYAF